MIRHHVSPPASPRERGRAFGSAHAGRVAANVAAYGELFRSGPRPLDVAGLGAEAWDRIAAFAPACAEEIAGLAEGAGQPVWAIAALNARTELLALAAVDVRGECSTAVALGDGPSPVSVQTWDWFDALEAGWLVWTIEHPGGRVVHTVTEYGILGKIGVTAGLGVHLNLLHHREDGAGMGVPVHVVARTILDTARDVSHALTIATGAAVSASSCLTLVAAEAGETAAVAAELCPAGPGLVLPDDDGLLLHTNHFRSQPASFGDREPVVGPDSFLRLDLLRRRLRRTGTGDPGAIAEAMCSHVGAGGALCCHPDPAAGTAGDPAYATLATVALDAAAGRLAVRAGGPCASTDWWSPPAGGATARPIHDLQPTTGEIHA